MNEEAIKQVFNALVESGEKESAALAEKLVEAGVISPERVAGIKTVEDFFFALIYPYQKFLDGFISIHFSRNNNAQWLFTHHGYVENHFQKLIAMHEGTACCADKSRTIINALARWLKDGTEIVWNYEGEYTFHLPKKVFTTHESIALFFEALMSLYYGNPEKYLHFLHEKRYLTA